MCVNDIDSEAFMLLQNYQNFIEINSNMIFIVALGVGLKCPQDFQTFLRPCGWTALH